MNLNNLNDVRTFLENKVWQLSNTWKSNEQGGKEVDSIVKDLSKKILELTQMSSNDSSVELANQLEQLNEIDLLIAKIAPKTLIDPQTLSDLQTFIDPLNLAPIKTKIIDSIAAKSFNEKNNIIEITNDNMRPILGAFDLELKKQILKEDLKEEIKKDINTKKVFEKKSGTTEKETEKLEEEQKNVTNITTKLEIEIFQKNVFKEEVQEGSPKKLQKEFKKDLKIMTSLPSLQYFERFFFAQKKFFSRDVSSRTVGLFYESLKESSKNLEYKNADTFFENYKKAEVALCNYDKDVKDEKILIQMIESKAFPLDMIFYDRNSGGLSFLECALRYEKYAVADKLLEMNPHLIDIPNEKFEFENLTFSEDHLKIFKKRKDKDCPHLWKACMDEKNLKARLQSCLNSSDKQSILNDPLIFKNPNRVAFWLNQEMKRLDSAFSDVEIYELIKVLSPIIKGQAGKNILHAAIYAGQPKFVKLLLDLNVSPTEVYGKPLASQSEFSLTPMQQALNLGRLDVISVLIEKGGIDAIDTMGRSVWTYIQENPKLSSNMELRRLVEPYLDQSKIADYKNERFQKALEIKNWTEVYRMIQEGFIPQGSVEKWVTRAIVSGQLSLINLLIEKNLIKTFSLPMALCALTSGHSAWNQAFFAKMVKRGLDLNESIEASLKNASQEDKEILLNKFPGLSLYSLESKKLLDLVIDTKDYGLAAFLMKLGAKSELKASEFEGLIHFATCLKKGGEFRTGA